MTCEVFHGDCLEVLDLVPEKTVNLVYIDPPFNTGKQQTRTAKSGTKLSYADSQGSVQYLDSLRSVLAKLHDLLTNDGSIYVHLDHHEVHYVKVLMDDLFGRENFVNEVIWAYDYGGRGTSCWPRKHDNILYYSKVPGKHAFYQDQIERVPYLAPALCGAEKAERGKLPTDVLWHTIVPTNGKEKTGYPTQKPEGLLKLLVSASSKPGDTVLDCFAGSGTTGVVATQLGRNAILIDRNPQAIDVIRSRIPSATVTNV